MTEYTKGWRTNGGTFSIRLQNGDDMGPVSIFKNMASLHNSHVSMNTD